jgi:hypothetical protein
MSMVTTGRIEELYFGFDEQRLLVRLDTGGGPAHERLGEIDQLRVSFAEPAGFEFVVRRPTGPRPGPQLFHNDVPVSASGLEFAAGTIVELAIPWRTLGVSAESPLRFAVELLVEGQAVERIPTDGYVATAAPAPDFDLVMWQA